MPPRFRRSDPRPNEPSGPRSVLSDPQPAQRPTAVAWRRENETAPRHCRRTMEQLRRARDRLRAGRRSIAGIPKGAAPNRGAGQSSSRASPVGRHGTVRRRNAIAHHLATTQVRPVAQHDITARRKPIAHVIAVAKARPIAHHDDTVALRSAIAHATTTAQRISDAAPTRSAMPPNDTPSCPRRRARIARRWTRRPHRQRSHEAETQPERTARARRFGPAERPTDTPHAIAGADPIVGRVDAQAGA